MTREAGGTYARRRVSCWSTACGQRATTFAHLIRRHCSLTRETPRDEGSTAFPRRPLHGKLDEHTPKRIGIRIEMARLPNSSASGPIHRVNEGVTRHAQDCPQSARDAEAQHRFGNPDAPKPIHAKAPEWMTECWKHRVEAEARNRLLRNIRGVATSR